MEYTLKDIDRINMILTQGIEFVKSRTLSLDSVEGSKLCRIIYRNFCLLNSGGDP